ncbi:Nucleoside-diphosphate-sugar epimerase [Candidatus Rhodobacter oscarellae]|uniref:Nucleoside-diphosphate-sugar epimerase n=1 Tax=Candidatus Rhodobacter oscarellae TaxID=1675527 RepID=A0A0J9E6T8_9RHOB|nr:D-erythronate dehydrogenase [Candidatus Rhodobacter lobularis]KMW58386.1 Nucleoside-diphosphate-sugar epimerase [Candidatus Rhodobacter lobularis]
MQRILILGGGGMIGQKLAWHLAGEGLNGDRDLDVTLHDLGYPEPSAPGRKRIGNVAVAGTMTAAVAEKPDVIFHLASVVSGEAEQDYDKGWAVNMHPMWELLEALRAHQAADPGYCPKVIFSSSIAVFGAPYPEAIGDTFLSAPLSSYGAQKAVCELMLSDASRKGFVDGISIRLPTVCVRPGKPNKAASGFFSGIIREPLNGKEAVLPVDDSVRHWLASPRSAVGFLVHAAGLDSARLEGRRALNMPGFSCTIAEQIEALRRAAGEDAVKLIRREPDEAIINIVKNWPRNFQTDRALALGFTAESDFDEIIRVYIEDERPGC